MNSKNLLTRMHERHSTRSFDGDRKIEPGVMQDIYEAARWAPTGHNMQNFQLLVVDDGQLLERIGRIKVQFSPEFIKWNAGIVSHSEEELKQKKVGMLASGFPPSWYTKEAIEGKADPATLKGSVARIMADAPVLMLVLLRADAGGMNPNGSPNDIMSIGCMVENVWLIAQAKGLGMRIASPIAAVEGQLREILGFPSEMKVATCCCLGYPAPGAPREPRVRRDIDDFVFLNGYAK